MLMVVSQHSSTAGRILIVAAFGLFARSLPETPEFQNLRDFASGIELADSIAGDCHKMLNVVSKIDSLLTKLAPDKS